jgi:hypothetical protein
MVYLQNEHDILTPLIRDVANYTQHEDCQLRGAIVQLLGKALRGALVNTFLCAVKLHNTLSYLYLGLV